MACSESVKRITQFHDLDRFGHRLGTHLKPQALQAQNFDIGTPSSMLFIRKDIDNVYMYTVLFLFYIVVVDLFKLRLMYKIKLLT